MDTTTYTPRHASPTTDLTPEHSPYSRIETVRNSAHPDRWAHDVTWHAHPEKVWDIMEDRDITSRDLHIARDGSLVVTLFVVGSNDLPLWSWGVWVTDPVLPPF